MQWAYLSGVRDYVLNKKDYLMSQVGNPDGPGKPNKKVRNSVWTTYGTDTDLSAQFYDPRVWVSF